MLASMGRRLFALVAVLVASCATPAAGPPPGSGGSPGLGGLGGSGIATVTSTGTGGALPGDDGGPPFVDAGACAPFSETYMPACLACLAKSCCMQATACFMVSDCFGYASCQQNCPPNMLDAGNTCLAECAQNYPMAEPAFGTMTACLHMSCAKVCPY
jgi:hypothetical protein